jgi:hypothetical protein
VGRKPSKPQPPPPAPPKQQQDKKKGKGWFKRLLVNGSDSDEWVSEDAARIERGSV